MPKSIPEINIGGETYQLKDRVARDHLVEVGSTQPTVEDNKLWIKEQENEYTVPTYDEFSDLKSALTNASEQSKIIDSNFKLLNSDFSIAGKYIDPSTGNEANNADYSATDYVFIHGLTHFELSGNTSNPLVAFYDENKTRISGSQNTSVFDVASNAYYIRLSIPTSEVNSTTFTIFRNDISSINIYNDLFYKNGMGQIGVEDDNNLLKTDTVYLGRYVVYNSGIIAKSSGFYASDFIPVSPATSIKVYKMNQCAFYTESKEYVSGYILDENENETIDIPSTQTIRYMRICGHVSDLPNAFVKLAEPGVKGYLAKISADKKNTYALLGLNSANLIDLDMVLDGKYVIYNTGGIASATGYSVTGFIVVVPGADYAIGGAASGSQLAYYDGNRQYISGEVTANKTKITVPQNNNIAYMRWCSDTAKKASFYIAPISVVSKTYTITSTEGLVVGIENAYKAGASKIIVEAGTYDLIAEYKAKYGNSYFDDYATNYNSLANGYNDRGLWLENIEIVFAQNAFVVCNYEGSNENVIEYFSAFAPGGNVVIDGLNLVASNLRYGLHPDFNPGTYSKFVMRNCDLSFINNSNQPRSIGAGLGYSCDWLFDTCIFRTPTGAENKEIVGIHNNESAGAKSIVTFRNCYVDGSGIVSLRWFGQSDKITECFIVGCSYESEPVVRYETGGQPYENIRLIKIGNEKRTQ